MGVPIHGKNGVFKYDSSGSAEVTVTKLQNWTVDIVLDTAEITSCGDTWKTRLGGFNSWTGTAQFLYDSTGLDLDLTTLGVIEEGGVGTDPLEMEFYLISGTTTRVLHGQGTIAGISVAQEMNDVVKVDVSITGIGAIAWAIAEPTYT